MRKISYVIVLVAQLQAGGLAGAVGDVEDEHVAGAGRVEVAAVEAEDVDCAPVMIFMDNQIA